MRERVYKLSLHVCTKRPPTGTFDRARQGARLGIRELDRDHDNMIDGRFERLDGGDLSIRKFQSDLARVASAP